MLRRLVNATQSVMKSDRGRDLLVALLLVAVVLVALWKLVFFEAAIQHDARTQLYPWTLFISDALNDGQLPLWNPYAFLGYPMHIDMQARVWFPPVWIIALTVGYTFKVLQIELVGYFVLAALAAFWCARVFGIGRTGAFIAAVSFSLSGAFVGNAQHLSWLISLSLLPLTLGLWRRAQTSQSLWSHLLLGAALGMVFLGGYPGFFIASSTMVGLLLLLFAIRDRIPVAPTIRNLAATGFAAAASSAVLLIPVLVSRHEITRGRLSLDFAFSGSINPVLLLQSLIPSIGVNTKDYLHLSLSNSNLYFGVITICLLWSALVGLPKRKDGTDRLFMWIGAVALLLCFGKFGFLRGVAYQFIPGYDQFRFPALFRGYFIISACLLAGFAFDRLFRTDPPDSLRRLRRAAIVIAVVILVIVIAVFVMSLFYTGIPATTNEGEIPDSTVFDRVLQYGPQQIIFLLALIALVTRTIKGRLDRRAAGVLVALLIAVDMMTAVNTNFLTVGETRTPFGRLNEREAKRPASLEPANYKIKSTYTPRRSNLSNDNIMLRKFQTGGYNPFQLRHTTEFVTDESHVEIIEQGIAFLAEDIEQPGGRIIFDRVASGSPRPPGKARIKIFELNRVVVDVSARKPAYLVLAQSDFPGWSATVDDSPAPILRAGGALRAVAVPAGSHRVAFRYRPISLIVGGLVSALFWAGLAAFGLQRWFSARNRTAPA